MTDVSPPFAILFGMKLPDEVELMKRSCAASVKAWNFMKKKLINATDLKKVFLLKNLFYYSFNYFRKFDTINLLMKWKKKWSM